MSVLPKELNYEDKLGNSVAAKTVRLSVTPYNNQIFASGGIIKLKLPSNKNSFFNAKNSYLKLTVNVGAVGTEFIAPDAHISSIISRLSSFSGGGATLLEQQDASGALYSLLLDIQTHPAQRGNVNAGMAAGGSFSILGGSAYGRRGVGLAQNTSCTYAFGLVSSVFGSQAKLFPIGELSDGVELHLQLADFRQAFIATTDAASQTITNAAAIGDADGTIDANLITISNVELVAEYIELAPQASLAIRQMNGGVYELPNEQYRAVSVSIPMGTTQTSLLINHRFSSIKNLWAGLYSNANQNTLLASGVSGRTKHTLSSYQYRVGSYYIPQKPVNCTGNGAEAFAEVEKCCRSGMNNILGSCSITLADWIAGGNAAMGGFVIGTALDTFQYSAGKGARSGINTLDSPIFLDLTFSTATTEALTAIVWAHIDSEMVVDATTGQVIEKH